MEAKKRETTFKRKDIESKVKIMKILAKEHNKIII